MPTETGLVEGAFFGEDLLRPTEDLAATDLPRPPEVQEPETSTQPEPAKVHRALRSAFPELSAQLAIRRKLSDGAVTTKVTPRTACLVGKDRARKDFGPSAPELASKLAARRRQISDGYREVLCEPHDVLLEKPIGFLEPPEVVLTEPPEVLLEKSMVLLVPPEVVLPEPPGVLLGKPIVLLETPELLLVKPLELPEPPLVLPEPPSN